MQLPEEFQDPILGTLMVDPVKLPSGHVMDKKVIHRHLLSTKTNPFNRQEMTESDLVEDTELRERIQKWKAEQKQKSK
ncbi:CRE-UFD-2 protein [Aphelenchoides bicaudatus]|nr:CRE-UFD-2 protein [Aphelenchoides bicaudatus]